MAAPNAKRQEISSAVLDASAVLAVLFDEPGAGEVRALLVNARVSAVNYSEVIAKALDRGEALLASLRRLAAMGFAVVSHDEGLARRAGELRLVTRKLGLSIGDRACLALAEREGLSVLTTDRAWANLDLPLDIRVIR
jgi:PIN domain nuclease of toxin-antitoxin system